MDLLNLTLTIILFLLFLLFKWIQYFYSPKLNLPPGPYEWPLLGVLPKLKGKRAFLSMNDIKLSHGNIAYFHLGTRPILLLSSLHYIKTTMRQDNFNARIQVKIVNRFTKNSGIIFTEGKIWQMHRRLSLQLLKSFGFGKNLSEENIRNEANELCQQIDREYISNYKTTSELFSSATVNVISTLVFNERPGYGNSEFTQFLHSVHLITQSSDFITSLPTLFSFIDNLAPILDWLPQAKSLTAGHDLILNKISQHRQHLKDLGLDYNNSKLSSSTSTSTSTVSTTSTSSSSSSSSSVHHQHAKNFTEAYLFAQQRYIDKHGKESADLMFNDWKIMRVLFELYLAGMDTTATTLCWSTLLLSAYPQIREKMSAEIHRIIGTEKIVTLNDKKDFHYSLAVIDEILRYTSIAPLAVGHRAVEQCKIDDYDIPANTTVLVNLYSLHHDPQVWEKPDEFYPEHFLSNDGKTYCPSEHLLPFGLGKRVCLGENLARMELFIFLITLVQRYEFHVVLDNGVALKEVLIGTHGSVRAPGEHKILFHKLTS